MADVILYTTAPEVYDGFGTRTDRVVGLTHGPSAARKLVRRVLAKAEHAEWQRQRYYSGSVYLTTDQADFDKRVAAGLIEPVADLGLFGFDDGPEYPGFSFGKTWNGWACPLFSRATLEQMILDGTLGPKDGGEAAMLGAQMVADGTLASADDAAMLGAQMVADGTVGSGLVGYFEEDDPDGWLTLEHRDGGEVQSTERSAPVLHRVYLETSGTTGVHRLYDLGQSGLTWHEAPRFDGE